jgi:hypothetical protein
MLTRHQYINDPQASGGFFENRILYAMCFNYPKHDDAYITAGKMITIGRVYAASPERGAGEAQEKGRSLLKLTAERLRATDIDIQLEDLPFETRFSRHLASTVIKLHGLLNRTVGDAICEWNGRKDKTFNRESFASKYLHFHRPNAFPILDSYSGKGAIIYVTYRRIEANDGTTGRRLC